MIDFTAPASVFQVGDRCQIKQVPATVESQGIITELIPGKNSGVRVHWDDDHWSLWDAIALEPSEFRPFVILQSTWSEICHTCKLSWIDKATTDGYCRLKAQCDEQSLTITAVLKKSELTFSLKTSWVGLDCKPVSKHEYIILGYAPNGKPRENWAIHQIDLKTQNRSAPNSTYYPSWINAYQSYLKIISSRGK